LRETSEARVRAPAHKELALFLYGSYRSNAGRTDVVTERPFSLPMLTPHS
jgi:hypothetical protein